MDLNHLSICKFDSNMSTATETIEGLVKQEYKYGFVTDVETESAPPGLNEDIIRLISAKKNEPAWLMEWRLKAYRHWLTMPEPTWQSCIIRRSITRTSFITPHPSRTGNGPKSLDEVDPKLLETYEKLGIPLRERGRLAGVAVDAVFDSVSVGTTYQEELAKRASSSARSAKRCISIRTWSKNISARWCRTRTIITRR